MQTLPAPVLNYLLKTTLIDRAPAYLCLSLEGKLIDWGGQLDEYGIVNLQQGGAIGTQVCFLEGLLPLNGSELFLPRLKTGEGRCADVYLFSDESWDWVLLLDVTPSEMQNQLLQQYRNHLNLLHEDHSRLIQRSLQSFPSPSSTTHTPSKQTPSEQKNLTILFADLRGFILFSDQHAPDTLFRILNLYLRTFIQAIETEAGLVDQVLGDAITGYFGGLPTLEPAATHAVRAGLKILAAVQEMNYLRQLQQQPTLDVGIGIASGSTALGVLSDRRYRVMSVIGYYVNLAAVLRQQANPGEILIDENTFNQATGMQQHFRTVDRSLLHLARPIKIYSTDSVGGSSSHE